jgi:tetratricopeptide (TPR) repeat protein
MEATRARRGPSDRTLNRLIVGIVVVLLIGIPVVGVVYFLDRNVDPGPSMLDRTLGQAEAAVRAEPNKLSARLNLAGMYLTAKRYQDAVTQYGQVLTADATSRAALLGRAKSLIALGDNAGATADLDKLIELALAGEMANVDKQLEAAYYLLGSIALTESRPIDAEEYLLKALAIDRTDADAMNLLGTAYLRNGKPADALKSLRRAVAFVPTGWCEPYAQMAQAYTSLGDAAGSAYAGGMVAFCEGRPDEGRAALQPLTGGAFAVDAMLGLAMIAAYQGDTAGATDYFNKVLEKDPENFSAITGLKAIAQTSHGATASPSAPAASPSAEGN